jgi:glyoxylate reductase
VRLGDAAEARWADLDELLGRSDFVSLHVPLTAATRHLVGEPELRRMKETAFLVNTSRGPVVDEETLVRALREGWIAGAALDVYEDEPDLTPGLSALANVVLAPHIGSASRDTRDRMATMAAQNALHHLRGERAPNPVNPQVYESEAWRARRERAGA